MSEEIVCECPECGYRETVSGRQADALRRGTLRCGICAGDCGRDVYVVRVSDEPAQDAASRARRAAQILIEEIGADGPENVEETAKRAAAKLREARTEIERLRESLQDERAIADAAYRRLNEYEWG